MRSLNRFSTIVASIIIPWCSLHSADDLEELQKLKSSYASASERALAPIKMTYIRELERLIEIYTKAGKLEAALAVKEELGLLPGANAADSSTNDQPSSKRDLEKILTTGTWTFHQMGQSEESKGNAEHTVEFGKDYSAKRSGKTITKWEVNREGELIYMSDQAPWVCRFKRVSDTLWVGTGIGTNAAALKFVHLEKITP